MSVAAKPKPPLPPLNVAIRIFPTGDGQWIALLNDFSGGSLRWGPLDDPLQIIDDVHEWLDTLVQGTDATQ